LEISPKIYLADGGVLNQILDVIEEKLGLPSDFSDKVFGECVETIKGAAQGAEKGGLQGGQPPQQAPASGPVPAPAPGGAPPVEAGGGGGGY
jgi:hypothetical protein